MKRFRKLGFALGALSLLALGACGNATSNDAELVVALTGDPVRLDPHRANDAVSATAINSIFERLIRQDEKGGLHPWLATEWMRIDDRTYEFTIRQDVVFHNGEPMTVEDVVFSLRRSATSSVTAPITGGLDPEAIVVMDESTVRVGTFEPFVPLLSHLAHTAGNIVPQALVESDEEAFGQNPVGTGAFKFESWQPGERIQLVRFDDYYDGPVALERLAFRPITESTNRLIELETGQVHIALDVSPTDLGRIDSADGIELLRNTNLRINYLGFNTQMAPFDDARIRQAINYAIDQDVIIDGIMEGAATRALGPFSSEVWGYNENLTGYDFNLERARELMAEAGFEDGFETTIYVDTDITRQNIATVLHNQLLAIGIRAQIVPLEWATFLEATSSGNHAMFILGWTSVTFDADYSLFPLFHSQQFGASGNRAFYSNPDVDRLLEAARGELDPTARQAYYNEVQDIIVDDAPWAFLFVGESLIGASSSVNGFTPNPTAIHNFNYVTLD
ncbi:MAG: glutathione ABC transporter substrate-binding protein [Turicibacter sp.]|nr:glutathione ABC transporter substrate-binding protein [Turicibacter sp.]